MDDSYQVTQIDMTLPYPSDPVNFLDCALTPSLVLAILACGSCQPGLHSSFSFPQLDGRGFVSSWYKKGTKKV